MFIHVIIIKFFMDNKKQDEDSEKLKYINENIIDKGYNPEDLNAFIINRRACSIEELKLELLKEEIDNFKNEQLKETFTTVKKTMSLTKRDEQLFSKLIIYLYKNAYYPSLKRIKKN